MASNTDLNAATSSGDKIVTKQRSHDGDTAKQQMVGLSGVTGTEDSYTFTDVQAGGGTEANALRVTIASDSTGVVSVDDNGGSLTVDGTVAISGSVAVTDNSGSLTVDDGGGSLTVDGTVAVSGTVAVTDNSGSLTVDNAGTFAVQATVAAAATNIAKAEDAASADGDVGVPALAVRKATPANTSGADGDYEFLQMSAGRLWASATIDAALPAGTNAIGKLAANSGVDIGDIDVTSVIPGTGATNLGKAEDAAHSSGDTGVLALGVRQDTLASSTSADGDYAALKVSAAGRLYVDAAITSGAGSGGTALADAATFTRGTTSETPVGGVVETSAPTLTNGQAGALSLTTAGALRVAVASGGIAGVTEDAASAGGEEGVMVLAVRRDSASSGVSADGDFAALSVDSNGALRVSGAAGTTQYTEDGASAGAESLCLMGAVRRDTAASSSGTDGDYSTVNTDSAGRLWVNASGAAVPVTDNSGSLTVDNGGTFAVQPAGSVAHDAAGTGVNPVLQGAYASAAAPTDVSADGDAVRLWALRSGAVAVQPTMAGVLAVAGNGASGAGVQRVTIANDSTGVLATVSNVATIGTSVTPGTSAAHLGKAEDAAHASGDTGVFALAVRTDTAAASSGTTGDYEALHTDSVGALWSRSTGELADDAAFTPGTSRVFPIGLTADESSTDSVDEGDIGAARMTLDRKAIVTPYVHAAAGGQTPLYNLDVDESEDAIKASAGKLFWIHVMNLSASLRYIKFYDDTVANVVVGTTTPKLVFPIPTLATTNGAGFCVNFGDTGVAFANAITVAATTGLADNNTGAPGANEVVLNCGYA